MKVQFINVSHPADRVSPRRIRMHAAREAHGRARRQRTAEYQARMSTATAAAQADNTLALVSVANASEKTETIEEIIRTTMPDLFPSPADVSAWPGLVGPWARLAMGPFRPEEHFLLDHYVRTVMPELNLHCPVLSNLGDYQSCLTREWVRLALTDTGSMSGLFLAACRHLALASALPDNHESQAHDRFLRLATTYKVACIQALNEAITAEGKDKRISDATLTKTMLLVFDEILIGDLVATRRHLLGAVKMVEVNGGVIGGFLNALLQRCVNVVVNDKREPCPLVPRLSPVGLSYP
ncbi:hypothetical protein B0T26DRAFT_713363 [Lasiosphaeria miniovina]|uniref:Uncharacterized protein n=1 Tax=Lasiosphaeria miniovina TaxID=1954250 RepID=A0AA40DYL1_9PEZI|nr:uncharacterized protein B0T26DRAFT_713363 [Lasiosphaeria miniovina]KAK0718447.1 hypothetical protein B0T26DRAFT_713363 [Lasiosphaeria miniovina]